jgi:purine nucleosidase
MVLISNCYWEKKRMPARHIIIDTDPGQDDAVALLMALASNEAFCILGLTAVAGNVGLKQNAINALKVVELSGRTDVPVFAGCSEPLERDLVTAEHVHGDTGLNGPDLKEPTIKLEGQHGVDFIIETLRQNPSKTITLCTLGPLTNIAKAFQKAPDIVDRCDEIIMMGGAYFQGGNITPAAEFNIYVDPDAADIVFRAGVPITMASLDVTHKVLSTKKRIDAIRKVGTNSAIAVADMLTFSERFDLEKYGWQGAPLHDPCVIAYLLKPELFTGRMCNVQLETTSELTMGMTVADFWNVTDHTHNVHFLHDVDDQGYFDLINECLSRLP